MSSIWGRTKSYLRRINKDSYHCACLTGSDVSHVTGSGVFGRGPAWKSRDFFPYFPLPYYFPVFFSLILFFPPYLFLPYYIPVFFPRTIFPYFFFFFSRIISPYFFFRIFFRTFFSRTFFFRTIFPYFFKSRDV